MASLLQKVGRSGGLASRLAVGDEVVAELGWVCNSSWDDVAVKREKISHGTPNYTQALCKV